MSKIAFDGVTEHAFLCGMNRNCLRLCSGAWLALLAVAGMAGESTNSGPRLQPARWLLVVDTSASMARRSQAIEGVVGELLSSGFNGQMQGGDELGIWTYNKKLFAGIAPMQIWDPARSNIISGRSARFIGRQKYQDQSRIETVIPELDRLVKGSRRLTVLLFSDGTQKIAGTPFDSAINKTYAESQSDLVKTRMPLVTVLRSERGEYIGYNVSFAPWPVKFPEFEPEPEIKKPAPETKPTKSIVIRREPKETGPPTNALSISNTPTVTSGLPIAELLPVPMVTVTSASPVQPVLPKPLEETNATAGVNQVETAQTEPPQSEPPETDPTVEPVAPATPPDPVNEKGQSESFSRQKWLLLLGTGCLWVAIAIALLLARRARRSNRSSLITRSLDRNRH